MDKPKSNQDVTPVEERLGVLDRRRIEAMVLGPLIRAYQEEIGQERASDIARRVITNIAREQGANMAKKLGANPDIQLTRTQTIMKGATHCNFRYKVESAG